LARLPVTKDMFHRASPNALTLANSALIAELLKGMDGAKRLALIARAAEALEKGPRQSVALAEAISLLRADWPQVSMPEPYRKSR
jgi:hypothetical protein